jgi:signal transduction histidine kinase
MVNRTALDPQTRLRSVRLPLRGPFTRWPRATDAVLAIALFLLFVFVTSEEPNDDLVIRAVGDIPIGEFIVFAVACGALIWRRSQPLVVLAVTLAASTLSLVLDYSDIVGFAMLVALYGVGRYVTDNTWSYIGVGGAIAVVMIGDLIDRAPATDFAFAFLVLFVLWYIGRRIRIRGSYLRLLQERAARLEKDQAAEARRAVAEERTRIARELHDVVAHRVTLMTVQAGAAKTVAADDPAGALQAMEAVEQAGRQALGELRHLLGVLRPEAEVDGLGPQPGIADIPRLVDQFAEAGLDVSLTTDALPTDLPARVDLSAYRIVQEALTNALKHAGLGARADVRISTDNHGVAIEVLDTGHGVTMLPGSGHGIVGMRERALLLGGSLDAGPRPGGGFQVVAHLPIGANQG